MATMIRADVIAFDDADPDDVALLGGKGASLVEMRRLGLPVPPGFVISTAVCRRFLRDRTMPGDVTASVAGQLAVVEATLGRRLGDPDAPLLVSVRSGAPVSMPGMMDTILDLGLCEETLGGLARASGDERFAWDCYVRLLHAYGVTVRGIDAAELGATGPADDLAVLKATAGRLLHAIEKGSGRPFPQDPRTQLHEAIEAVFSSWDSPRAVRYRRYAGISDDLGTAVVVQAMVFGNHGEASGTGVAFTRDPATGEAVPYGDFLARAQGDDVVAGEHDVGSLDDCRALAPDAYAALTQALTIVERDRRDMCEIEFTIEDGTLWILQSRPGQRTAAAAIRIATDLVDAGLIDETEAIGRIHPAALIHLRAPVLDPAAEKLVLGRGVAASPGAAVGRIAFNPQRAEEMAADGIDVVLVRPFTSPDDVAGMIAARGIVTAHGGRTSHAAVVARGMDRPAVCGVGGLVVTASDARFTGETLVEGDEISIDGARGEVYSGALPLVPPDDDPRIERILGWCDGRRRIRLLSEGTAAAWAEGIHDPASARVCRTSDDVVRAIDDGEMPIVDVGDPESAKGVLSAAADAPSAMIRVDRTWPAAYARLPPAPWTAVVATEHGAWAARLLAATAGQEPREQ